MWLPISSAPKDGSAIVCWAEGWEPYLLRWKTNHRIVNHQAGHPEWKELQAASYFGDLEEWDDYKLSFPGGGPTHWHPLAKVPCRGQVSPMGRSIPPMLAALGFTEQNVIELIELLTPSQSLEQREAAAELQPPGGNNG